MNGDIDYNALTVEEIDQLLDNASVMQLKALLFDMLVASNENDNDMKKLYKLIERKQSNGA